MGSAGQYGGEAELKLFQKAISGAYAFRYPEPIPLSTVHGVAQEDMEKDGE